MTALPNTVAFGNPPAYNSPLSSWVTVQNGHLAVDGQRQIFIGPNFTTWVVRGTLTSNSNGWEPYASYRDTLCAQLDNYVNLGVNVVRFNDMDSVVGGCNWWNVTNNPNTQTTSLDPTYMEAFDYVTSQCFQRGIRILPTLFQLRTLTAADAAACTWPCNSLSEMMATKDNGATGNIWPWALVDSGALQFLIHFAQTLLSHVNQYTGVAYADEPGVLGWTLANEHLACRDGYGLTDPAANCPIYAGKFLALAEAHAAANGIAWRTGTASNQLASLDKAQTAALLSSLGAEMNTAYYNAVRALTPALIIAGTSYGNTPWNALVELSAGDIYDRHIYSRNAVTDPNAFLTTVSPAERTVYETVLAGASVGGKPLPNSASEVGIVAQASSPLTQDPSSEQASELAALMQGGLAGDLDVFCWYAGGHHAFWPAGSDAVDVYDLRACTAFWPSTAQQLIQQFKDVTLRPTTQAAVPPTNGLYGTGTGSAYVQYCTNDDPAVLAVPAGQKVLVTA